MMDKASKQYTAFTVDNIGFFECESIPFWLCNASATFQRLMQNCLGELNLTYCLIYMDDMIDFPKTEKKCLHCLCVGVWVLQGAQAETQTNQQPSVNSWRTRSTTWFITSPRKVYDTARRTWKLWPDSLHHRPTLRSEPFWAWWDIAMLY